MSEDGARVAVVSGSAGGIGSVICRKLAEDGFRVVGIDLVGVGAPAPTPRGLQPPGHGPVDDVESIRCDMRDERSVADAIAEIDRKHGRIDAAVHCAGIARDGVVWKLSVSDWDEVQSVNLRGAFLLMRETIPVMRRNGGGRIVLIGSINGSRGKFGTAAYAASKAGLIGLAKSVSREAGRFGIRVNVVEPGWVVTDLTESRGGDLREKALAETQLGELVEPADVANAISFLCGDGGRHITGQILRVDSGQYV